MWRKILFHLAIYVIIPSYPFNFSEQLEKITAHHNKPSNKYTSCFGNLGCISTTEEWYHHTYRPKNLEPLDRHTIKTEFYFITNAEKPSNTLKFDYVNVRGESNLGEVCRHPQLVLLIHDFTSNGYTGWIKHISSILLKRGSMSVLSVDWQAGAEPPFEQAVSNARVVALEILSLLKTLKAYGLTEEQRIYIIGHGLGAHIAGYVGHMHAVHKITGLDPTGAYFEHMPPVVRLDPSDAQFVEVLHTDAFSGRSQGTQTSMGHVDFFLNGAKQQTNCNDTSPFSSFTKLDRNSLKEGDILPACSHKRSFKYFIESARNKNCEYIGFECYSYKDFEEGKCTECQPELGNCAKFGPDEFGTDKRSFTYYLHTSGSSPYCMFSYRVQIFFEDETGTSHHNGNLEMIMIGDNGILTTGYASNCGSPVSFKAVSPYAMIYYAKPPLLSRIVEVRLKWVHNPNAICLFCKTSINVNKLSIQQVSIRNPKTRENHMCATHSTEIKSGFYITLTECEGPQIMTTVKN